MRESFPIEGFYVLLKSRFGVIPYPVRRHQGIRSLFSFLLWSALFSVVYTQSPLYTSNQNTYFLHGLACAEVGYLRQDWLANTRDLTPLFSALVCLTRRWLGFEGLFYGYYTLILGLYFVSLYQLAQQEVDLSSRARRLAFLALFFLLHSAGWRFALSRTLGNEWTYAFEGGLANQRLLGNVFQPSVFGVFLLSAVTLATQQRITLSILSLAIAFWFHPTYLLPATLLYCGIVAENFLRLYRSRENSSPRNAISQISTWSILFLLLALPTALYALSFSFSPELSPDLAERGRTLLFKVRIPHHADPTVWFNPPALFQLGLMVAALILTRQRGLRRLVGIPLMLSAIGTFLVLFTQDTSLALLFPWRVTTVLVPLSLTLLLGRLVDLLPSETQYPDSPWLVWIIPSTCTGLIASALLVGWMRMSLDLQRQRNQPERPLMEFVAKHKQPQDLYLIPVKMQDFRLATGAPVFVDFKSTPYHPIEVVEWHRRIQIASDFYQAPSCEKIPSLAREGITHVVLQAALSLRCPNLHTIYSDAKYELLRITP
ncbi:MAG: DUF6798 domain-containing protein [Anaerolineales bacterium]|nr:hypothetical protein [Anaerolineales bacterium]MCS7246743.1 hypothetical protein [Anaerolineales bacterium]MDW8160553.1 DUF6798 domain-containing protein [Anaerolineales bacterium]MDW8448222.1 DUF6798 domain-containing protein [Anaerolineales bacterium]